MSTCASFITAILVYFTILNFRRYPRFASFYLELVRKHNSLNRLLWEFYDLWIDCTSCEEDMLKLQSAFLVFRWEEWLYMILRMIITYMASNELLYISLPAWMAPYTWAYNYKVNCKCVYSHICKKHPKPQQRDKVNTLSEFKK